MIFLTAALFVISSVPITLDYNGQHIGNYQLWFVWSRDWWRHM